MARDCYESGGMNNLSRVESLTFEVSTWFQVHRDVDEYCFTLKLAVKPENFEVCCVEYNENDIYTRGVVEFALALIEFATDSTRIPKIKVTNYDARADWGSWAPPETYEVSIVQVREGAARLFLRHQPFEELEGTLEGVWFDELRTIYFDLLEEDVRRMGYSLLSAVGADKGNVYFSFDLHRAAPPPADLGNDVDIPF